MHTDQVTGWLEVLFRKERLQSLKSLDDLRAEDYEMIGAALPLAEFEGVYQVYETFNEGGLPRSFREYDVVNFVCTNCGAPVVINMLLLNKQRNSHLIDPITDNLQWRDGKSLVGLTMKNRLPSLRYGFDK